MSFCSIRFLLILPVLAVLVSCGHKFEGTTINGAILNGNDRLVLLEDVATQEKVIVDSSYVRDGSVSFRVYINDGVYRLRETTDNNMVFIYIGGSGREIQLTWDMNNPSEYNITGSRESQDIRKIVRYARRNEREYYLIDSVARADTLSADRVLTMKDVNRQRMYDYVRKVVDSLPDADIAAFALNYVGAAPDKIPFLIKTTDRLHEKDPEARYAAMWYESMDAYRKQALSAVENGLPVGTKAPEINLPAIKGDTFSLAALQGQYVLIDFWASWCQPCRKENPTLVEAYKEFKNRKFTIVSISLDSKREQWEQGIRVDKLIWPYHLSDLKKWRSPVVNAYQVKGIPASFLVDPAGKIIARDLRSQALLATLDNVLPPEMIEVRDSLGNVTLVPKIVKKKADSLSVPAAPVAGKAPVTPSPAKSQPVTTTTRTAAPVTPPQPAATTAPQAAPGNSQQPVRPQAPAISNGVTPKPATTTNGAPAPKPVTPKPVPKPSTQPAPAEEPQGSSPF